MVGFRLFTYNPYNGEFYIDMNSLKLTKEFYELWLLCKEQCGCSDVNDENVIVGNQDAIQKYNDYCKYIYLTSAWSSPYFDYVDDTKISSALNDSGLELDDIKNDIVDKAISKFNEIQSQDRNYRLLNAAKTQIDDLITYFEIKGKLETKVDGKPVYKSKDILDEIKKIGEVSDYLDRTEERVKKGEATQSNIKGGATEGFIVDFVKERERREKELAMKLEREKEERKNKKERNSELKTILNPVVKTSKRK